MRPYDALSALLRRIRQGRAELSFLSRLSRRLEPALLDSAKKLQERSRPGACVCLFPPDPARVRADLRQHHRKFDAGGPAAREHLAIGFYARCAPVSACSLSANGRLSNADHGAIGNGKR